MIVKGFFNHLVVFKHIELAEETNAAFTLVFDNQLLNEKLV